MNKKEFLEKLKHKIDILNDEEIEDIINEYSGYIDEKVNNGKTEKEAVKELGNINEIANDLLEAYKVKSTQNEKNIIEKIISWITDFVDVITSNIKGKSLAEIIKFCLLLAAILLIILIAKLPFVIIENAGVGILHNFNGKFVNFLANVWVTIIEFSYLFIAVIAFVTIAKKEFLKDNKKEEKKIPVNKSVSKKEQIVKEEPRKGFIGRFVDFCMKCLLIFIKVICCFFLLGMAGYLIGVSFGLIVILYLFFQTFKFLGLIIIFIGLISAGIAFFELIFNFVVNRQSNFKRIFITIVFSLLVLGMGIGLTSLRVAKMNFKAIENKDTKEIVYKMKKDLLIKDFNESDFIIDEKEKDIKVVYSYNKDIVKLKKGEEIFLYNFEYAVNNKKIYDLVMNGLKNDTFYYDYGGIDVKIYVSKKNFELLKNNYLKYEKTLYSGTESDNCNCECFE